MTTLFRWVFYGFLSRVIGTMLALLVIFVIIESFDKSRYLGQGLTLPLLIEYLLLKLPLMVQELMPVVVLLACSLLVTELSRNNEMVALRAAGIGLTKVLTPLLLAALLCSCVNIAMSEWITPVTNQRLDRIEQVNIRHLPEKNHGTQWLKEEGRFYRLQPLEKDQFQLTMIETDEEGGWLKRVEATHAIFNNQQWLLKNVDISSPAATEGMRVQHFDKYTLDSKITLQSAEQPDPSYMNFFELWRYASDLERAGLSSLSFELSLQQKLTKPLSCLVMILLAFALCIHMSDRHGKVVWYLIVCIALGLFLYVGANATGFIALSGQMPVAFAAWFPNMFFAGLAGFIFLHREGY
ncbi:MAG: LPS export ABC transporter permease LptG [Mariprofundaceae bacterium]|nr:LPS export ABC transporter permease LptG [Mariprofundaceae bacterium]